MRRVAGVIIVTVLLALPGMLLQPALAVTLITGDGDQLICARVETGARVELQFTHSMYGGYVRESYRVDSDGTLSRQRIITENAAAAEYYATDGRTRRTNDGWEVLAPPFETRELVIRVDERGDHRLTIDGTSYHLADRLTAPTQVRIGTTHISTPWRSACE